MTDTGLNALLFLVSAVFDLYLFVLIMRLILAWVHAEYTHPITQMVIKLTSFIVKPMNKVLPTVSGIEISTVVLILLVEGIKYFIMVSISYDYPGIMGLLILSVTDAIKSVLQLLFYAVLLEALMSWLQPYTPINQLLSRFTGPIMQPLRRLIPLIGGVDITPIPAILILQFLIICIMNPLLSYGLGVALGA